MPRYDDAQKVWDDRFATEGTKHVGRSALVDLVARKPTLQHPRNSWSLR